MEAAYAEDYSSWRLRETAGRQNGKSKRCHQRGISSAGEKEDE